MKSTTGFKKLFKASAFVGVCFVVLYILFNGIIPVPSEYRNQPVSVFTPDLTWDSRPSDIILKYGSPKNISKVSDITGERNFNFSFVYDDKEVSLSISNRYTLNASPHRYHFTINCKSPEDASVFFDECHENIMDLYENEPDFNFESNTQADYEYADGSPCEYIATYEDGIEKIYVIDENMNEIPLENADNVVIIESKENNYDMLNTIGTHYSLIYYAGESRITLQAEILY